MNHLKNLIKRSFQIDNYHYTDYQLNKEQLKKILNTEEIICEVPSEISQFDHNSYYLKNGFVIMIYRGIDNIEETIFLEYGIMLWSSFYDYLIAHQDERDTNTLSKQILEKETFKGIEIIRFGDPQIYWSFKLAGGRMTKVFGFNHTYFQLPNGKFITSFEYTENDYLYSTAEIPNEYLQLLKKRKKTN